VREDLVVPTSHSWTGDPGRPAFDPPQAAAAYTDGTTTARRLRRGGEERVFTRRYRTVPFAFVLLFGGIVSTLPPTVIWAGDASAIRVATVVAALAVGTFAYRVIRLGITVKPGEVVVRNILLTRRVSTDAISRFDPPSGGIFRGGVRVVKRSGHYISASAFGTMNNFESPDRGHLEAAELNAWLADDAADASPSRPLVPIRAFGRTATLLWRAWLVIVWLLALFAAFLPVGLFVGPV
jgi:hypothetical protein